MRRPSTWLVMWLARAIALTAFEYGAVLADELDPKALRSAIESAKGALLKAQEADGSWRKRVGDNEGQIATTSLVLRALLSTQMDANAPEINRGLDWLRRQDPVSTKDISLVIQALVAARKPDRDLDKVAALAAELEKTKIRDGSNAGSWPASLTVRPVGFGDRGNAFAAILGLDDAATFGIPIDLETWRRAREHWLSSQNADGSWSDRGGKGKNAGWGSMTSAGIAALRITHERFQRQAQELKIRESEAGADVSIELPLEDARRWMGNHFAVKYDPGSGNSVLNYLENLGRAGRLSKWQHFIDGQGRQHDWYVEAAEFLVQTQNQFTGTWRDSDTGPVFGTSLVLMFLSNGGVGD